MNKAVFAAGCFWGVEDSFQNLPGVKSAVSGYTGGHTENPGYREVCSGKTGHAEAVMVEYDPDKISYEDLLANFWKTHNPTTLNRQGPDVGSQYRSAIFYVDDDQKKAAEESLEKMNRLPRYDGKIVTEISKLSVFYTAEEYHQDYYKKKGVKGCGF